MTNDVEEMQSGSKRFEERTREDAQLQQEEDGDLENILNDVM